MSYFHFLIRSLYCDIRAKTGSVVRPVKELKGFSKIELKPGASKTVFFILTNEDLGFYNNDGIFIVEPGEFEVMVGSSSDDIRFKDKFQVGK